MNMTVKRLLERAEKARDTYVASKFENIETVIEELVERHTENLVMKALGLKRGWGDVEVEWNSPLAKMVGERAKVAAEDIGQALSLAFSEVKLSQKELKAIHTVYKKAFIEAAFQVAEDQGHQEGEGFASKVIFTEPVEGEER